MTSETLNRHKSLTPLSNQNFKINIFLKKRLGSLYCQVILSKKWHFWHFLKSMSVGNWLFLRAALKSYLTSLTPPPPLGRALPLPIVGAPSSIFKYIYLLYIIYYILNIIYYILLYILYIYISELPTTALAWRRASHSPIGRLRSHIRLLAALQRQFI